MQAKLLKESTYYERYGEAKFEDSFQEAFKDAKLVFGKRMDQHRGWTWKSRWSKMKRQTGFL
jgi:hypothetical protein